MINMINPDSVRTNLEALANTFEASDPRGANRLRNLRSAVGNSSNADAWGNSDIYRLIAPELIIERYKSQRTTDTIVVVLEWLRNSLIFMPLVVTWLGISQAMQQYNALIKAEPNQITQPFLYLWQNGFGSRLQWWDTLSGIATIDFTLLALVLLMTILVYTLSSTVKLRREQEAEQLRIELIDTIASAVLCLTTRNWQQPTDFVARFDQSARFFRQSIEQLLTRIENLATIQQQDHQTFNDFRRDLATIMNGVSASVSDLKTSNNALMRSMGALTSPVTEVSNLLGPLGTSAQEAVNLYNAQINSLDAVVKSLQLWGTNLQGVLGKLDRTVQTATNMATNISNFTAQEKDLVETLKREVQLQDDISSKMVSSSDNMSKVVLQILNCANELSAANVQMNELIRRLAGYMAGAHR